MRTGLSPKRKRKKKKKTENATLFVNNKNLVSNDLIRVILPLPDFERWPFVSIEELALEESAS